MNIFHFLFHLFFVSTFISFLDAKGGGASRGGGGSSSGGGSSGGGSSRSPSSGGSRIGTGIGSSTGTRFFFVDATTGQCLGACIASAVITAIVGVLALVCCCWCLIKRRKRQRGQGLEGGHVGGFKALFPTTATSNVPPPPPPPVALTDAKAGPNTTGMPVPPTYAAASGTEQVSFYPKFNDASYASYQAALAFVRNNPIVSAPQDATLPPFAFYTFHPAQESTPLLSSSTGIQVSSNGHGISFTKKEDASIQTPYPIPIRTLSEGDCYYFEVTITKKSHTAVLAIGLATRPYPPFRLPGWEYCSIGYHSDDGHKFISDPYGGTEYATPYTEGDVIGCGYRPSDGLVFYTKNGMDLGMAGVNVGVGMDVYPTVGADGVCQVEVNFGQGRFVFSAMDPVHPPKQG